MAFTLTELLIVTGIIVILMALLFPAISRGIDSARKAGCIANLRTLGATALTYAGENRGYLPATYNFRQFDSEGNSTDTLQTWNAAMDPYLPVPPSGSNVRSAYRCPANPIRGRNYALVHMVARFSTYTWDPRKNLFKLTNQSKVPYLLDGPPTASQITGQPTTANNGAADYVVLSPGAGPGGTAIRTRTGPNNPANNAPNSYWIPPHDRGKSLNILYVDGSVKGVPVPFFISNDPETGFFSENIIPPGNPNPNP